MTDFPALDPAFVDPPSLQKLEPLKASSHPPRFLLLYGSLRDRSFSRLLIEEADRLLRSFGAETRIYDPRGLPQPDDAPADHPSGSWEGPVIAALRACAARWLFGADLRQKST